MKKTQAGKQSHNLKKLFLIPLWVLFSYALAQVIFIASYQLLVLLNVPIDVLSDSVFNTIAAAFVYTLSLAITLSGHYFITKNPVNLKQLGIDRLPLWKDIGLAPLAFLFYFILSGLLLYAATELFQGFNLDQVQETGFDAIGMRYEYIIAFITLVIIAPIAEEVLFRGYLYGKIRQAVPVWLAVLVTSVLFGLVHGQWNVALDTFALSVMMCALREITGSIWSGTLLHMLKNSVAFYLLFVNPLIGGTIGV